MTTSEAKRWMAEVNASKFQWVLDRLTLENSNELLVYNGGESGKFIRVTSDGEILLGTYEDAYPHIGEAAFTVTARTKRASFDEAITRVLEVGGPRLVYQFMTGDRY